jgi:kynurenine formamidase
VSDLVFEPLQERAGRRVSRSPWGSGDEIGRLNWMTAESRAAVLSRATGPLFDLAVTYRHGMPAYQATGDPDYQIFLTHTPDGTRLDDLTGQGEEVNACYSYAGTAISMYAHAGTHVCSLNHIGHDGHFWNGWSAGEHLGSRAWTVGGVYPPVIARGVLLDVAGALGVTCLPDSYAITAADLHAAERRAGVEVERGDVVLVRTGRMTRWGDRAAFMADPPGLGMEAARHLAEIAGAMCVGVDAGGEALPPEAPGTFLPVHAYLLATAGMPFFEHLWLEDIAAAGAGEFAFIATPLKLAGSTGCPARPIAIAFQ